MNRKTTCGSSKRKPSIELSELLFKKINYVNKNDSPPAGWVPVTLETFYCLATKKKTQKRGGNVEVTLV